MAGATDFRRVRIMATLDELIDRMENDVLGTGCVSMDGIVLCSRFPADLNQERTGAVAATMLGVSRQLAHELRIGAVDEAILKASHGTFMVLPVSEQFLLAVHLQEGANLGLVRFAAHDAAESIARILQIEREPPARLMATRP